jgi:endo-beta-N-acetylglucosaminidase D
MAGGYLDDRFATGCATEHIYNFYNWQFVDTFIYFSHHRITVPRTQSPSRVISICWNQVKRVPLLTFRLFCFSSAVGWIDAAHRNGVKVLVRAKASFQ